ncbi:YkyA family protein [Paenibacillus sp. KN14-4R]|uniref:YkyA family protein n=1 Tax=Paenibacillus sp. KN14-4R TaxID=3445773 RepID=UPI003F9F747B
MRKQSLIAIGVTMVILLTGCQNQQLVQSSILKQYEEALQIEVSRTKVSNQISDMEQADQRDFDKIVLNGKKSNLNVKNLIEKCLQNIEERKALLSQEKQALTQANDVVKNMNANIGNLGNTDMKTQASSVLSLYERRYAVYQNMRTIYERALDQEKGLYDKLAEPNCKLVDIDNLVFERNNNFNQVAELMDQFNELTEQFNKEYKELENVIGKNKK